MKPLLKPFYLSVYVTRDFQRGEGFFCSFHSGGGKGLGRGGGENGREGKGREGVVLLLQEERRSVVVWAREVIAAGGGH